MIISVNLSKSQQATMKRIMKSGKSGKLRLTKSQIENGGPHYLKLNMAQAKKVMSSMNRKKGLDIEFTKSQIVEMSHKQQGGFIFLPFLVAAAEAAAPYVASAVGGYIADKAINYIGDALFGTGLQPYTPQEGGAWYENKGKDKKTGEPQSYSRSGKRVRTVCFVKGPSTAPSINNGAKIAPQTRGRSTGRPKNSKNKPKPVLVPRDNIEGEERKGDEPMDGERKEGDIEGLDVRQIGYIVGNMTNNQIQKIRKGGQPPKGTPANLVTAIVKLVGRLSNEELELIRKEYRQRGGAWFTSNPDEDTYIRDPDQNRVVCFEKYTKPGRIMPETRKQSKGRPKNSKNKPKQRGGCMTCPKKKNKK